MAANAALTQNGIRIASRRLERRVDEALGLLEAAVQHELVRDAALQMSADEDLISLQNELRFKALVRKVAATNDVSIQ
jgi:hypothetical protein